MKRGTLEVNQTLRFSRSMSWTWAKHLQFRRHARGSQGVETETGWVLGVAAEARVELMARAALLGWRRRDGRSVRISLTGVMCRR